MKVEGSGIVVAGGGSGLGLAAAAALRDLGASVGVIDLHQGGWDGAFVQADVADERAVEQAFDALASATGTLRIMLNTTGRQPARGGGTPHVGITAGPGRTVTAEAFRRALDVNALGSFILTRAAAERMITAEPMDDGERGVIVNTSSIVAMEGQIGTVAYAASKGAINAMTLPLAREYACWGVRVMAIAPGIFDTPMFSSARGAMVDWLRAQTQFPSRPGEAGEFAAAVRAVIENPMFNGDVIRLDGAMRVPAGRREWWEG